MLRPVDEVGSDKRGEDAHDGEARHPERAGLDPHEDGDEAETAKRQHQVKNHLQRVRTSLITKLT